MPNALGINILDSAQLQPDAVIDVIRRLDMAHVTIVDGSHPDKAFALAARIRQQLPAVTVFYRRWRADLPDETFPDRLTPRQWLDYFADVMAIGCAACTMNEAGIDPLTRHANWQAECIELASARGWQSVAFKMATGNPGGYRGETTRPDGYAEADELWRTIERVNKQAGKPLAYVAPHSYFAPTGFSAGLTDRHTEILRRWRQIGLDTRHLYLAHGEIGTAYVDNGQIDANRGYKTIPLDSRQYAQLLSDVIAEWCIPFGVIPHLYCLGQSVGGHVSASFDTLGDTAFWDELAAIAATGKLKARPPTPTPARKRRGLFVLFPAGMTPAQERAYADAVQSMITRLVALPRIAAEVNVSETGS